MTEAEYPAERRLDQPILQARDDGVEARLLRRGARAREVEIPRGPETLVRDVLLSAQLVLRVVEVRARFRKQRRFLLVRELDEHRAGLDVVAVLEVHAPHGVGDLRVDDHGLVRLRRAERFDDVVELIFLHARDRHERRLLVLETAAEAARASAARRTTGAAGPAARRLRARAGQPTHSHRR